MKLPVIAYLTIITACHGIMGSALADDSAVLPAEKSQNGITYLSGGIGSDQVTAMKAAANDYTLMLVCAIGNTGAYLADVKINIADKTGKTVLETVAEGPIILVKLTPGTYQISADNKGSIIHRTVKIGASHPLELNLSWPEKRSSRQ